MPLMAHRMATLVHIIHPAAPTTHHRHRDHPLAKKRRRARAHQNSSSSSEEDNNDEEGTSGLLQQLRQERDDAKSKKSSSANPLLLNTSSTTTSTKKKSKDTTNWMHQYKSNDSQMTAQENATRTAEYHPANQDKASADADGDGDYNNSQKNASSQNAQIAALQKQPRNKFLAGPLRATTFVRTTVRFDYQPDICKDYKETGFCGFGDTCIYLHDRGDTKSGWQMEAEYEEKKKKEEEKKSREMEIFMNSMMCGEVKGSGTMTSSQSSSSIGNAERNAVMAEDGIPFACHTCRGPFQNPIVTTCGHYFCEKCMMTRIREVGSGCPICQKDTHGVMNHPQKLVAKKRRLVGRDGTWEEYLERSKGSGDGDDAA
mmetsp:Transcript_6635/g.11565  ORF Transcript_6635/g.11565 Transcript_6635/m.11565 type:complete len:372 (-) Transcript_6635:273-1388(-)